MKYIIDIEDVPFRNNERELFKCRQFNSLVFDKNGLEKLLPYEPQRDAIADNARKEVWELVQKLASFSCTSAWCKVYPLDSLLTILLDNSYEKVKGSFEKVEIENPIKIFERGQEWITTFNDRVVIVGKTDEDGVYLIMHKNGDIQRINKGLLKNPTNKFYNQIDEVVNLMKSD